MNHIFLLLVLFQIKHFVADYPLQNKYMLQKFKPDWGFFLPLLAHASVHAAFTFLISLIFTHASTAFLLGLLDLIVHFSMDRIKASPKYLGRFKPLTAETYPTSSDQQKKDNTYFWWSLGLDQGVHHLTHYLIIYLILLNS